MKIGKTIRVLRKKRGMSQKYFAEMCGISSPYLSQVETGKKLPTISLLEKLSEVLGVPLSVYLWLSLDGTDVSEEKRELFLLLKPVMDSLVEDIFDLKTNE